MQQKLYGFPSQNNMGMGSHGYPQQYYTEEENVWMESQAQQQSHGFHEESWNTGNNHHKYQQFPGKHMKPGMFQDGMAGGHGYGHGGFGGHDVHGGGKKYPYGGTPTHAPHHQLSHGGANSRYNHGGGGHLDYVAEEYEYEANYKEGHVGAPGMAKMDEKRYENHNWGGDVRYANPYGHTHGHGYNNMKPHPHGYGHKAEWSVKGV